MKNLTIKISALAIALCGIGASAEVTDTIMTIVGADHLVITENPQGFKAVVSTETGERIYEQTYESGTTVVSHLSQQGFSLTGNRTKTESSVSWDMISGGLGIGFCSAPGAPKAAGIEQGKSFELSFLNILAAQARIRYENYVSLGVGINWRNYRTTLDNCFTVTDGQVAVGQYPEGVSPRLSRIKIFSVQFPLLYTQWLPFGICREKMAIKLGPIFNLNTYGSVLTAWRDGNSSAEYKVHNINVRPFTIDLFASIHLWDFCAVYARYSPYNALTGNSHLNFHQFSTGIMWFM